MKLKLVIIILISLLAFIFNSEKALAIRGGGHVEMTIGTNPNLVVYKSLNNIQVNKPIYWSYSFWYKCDACGTPSLNAFYVDWGDGYIDYLGQFPTKLSPHYYTNPGTYNIEIVLDYGCEEGFLCSSYASERRTENLQVTVIPKISTPSPPPQPNITPTINMSLPTSMCYAQGKGKINLSWTTENAKYALLSKINYTDNRADTWGVSTNGVFTDREVDSDKTYFYYLTVYNGDKRAQKIVSSSVDCNNVIQGLTYFEDGSGAVKTQISVSATKGPIYAITSSNNGTYSLGGLERGVNNISARISDTNYQITSYSFCENCLNHGGHTLISPTNKAIFSAYVPNGYLDLWFGVKKKETPVLPPTFNVLMIGKEIQINRDNLKINYDSNAVNNPPPGFKELLSPVWEETNP